MLQQTIVAVDHQLLAHKFGNADRMHGTRSWNVL